jgi:PAS domain S-box-containing protein
LPFYSKTTGFTKHFSKPLLPATLLICSIILTLVAWYISRRHLQDKAKDRFEYNVSDIHSAIRVRMLEYEQVLRNAVGFFYAADTVTRSEWKTYVQTLRLQEFYPGILGLGYTVRLSPSEVESFTKKIQAEGFPDFKVWPEERRDEYHSIVFLEPFEGRNLRAFGFDMYTEEKRRKAMQRAENTGEPALSQMVILVQETSKDVQKGCLLYLPVYDRRMPLATQQQRQAALKGFVYSPFRMKDLMRGILGSEAVEIEFEIYDGKSIDTSRLFFASHGYNSKKENADFSTTRPLQVAGHDWTLVFTSREPYVTTFETSQPNIIALAGILVNLLLLFFLVNIHSLSRRNRVLAERYKAEKDRYEIVSESTSDIIWEWDLVNDNVRFNKNYEAVLGYQLPASELSYQEWISHIHPDDRHKIRSKINDLLTSGNSFWSDEYRLVKKDGASIYILDRGRMVHDTDGRPVKMVGSMINITERKQAEETQRHFNEELERTVEARTMQLQRSNEDLERFAHVASHDLKEPVRKILTIVDKIRIKYQHLLGEGTLLLDKLTKSTTRLNQMIESILIFSTVNYETHGAENVDLNKIMRDVEDDLELIISEKEAQLVVDPLPAIEGSAALFHQLFYNLINNSLKFSKAGIKPVIHISSTLLQNVTEETVELRLTDNGIGFNQSEAARIFQSFVRLHSKDSYEGTGLGLALCKRIVERHRGTIEAFGSPESGATFIIHLPLKQKAVVI